MKKAFIFVLAGCFVFITLYNVEAGLFGKKKSSQTEETTPLKETQPQQKAEEPKKEPEQKKIDKAQQAAINAKRAIIERKRAELNNTEWQIELMPLSGKGAKETDTVVFKNNQVSSTGYGKKGFPATNYTLTVEDNGVAVWETMQTSEKSGVVFWRGEIDPGMESNKGIVSYHLDESTIRDYSFVSTAKRQIVPEQK